MKKMKILNVAFALERAIAQALINAKSVKTFDEKTLYLEIIEIKERFSIQEVIQENFAIQELLQQALIQKKGYSVIKIRTNFQTDFANTLDLVAGTTQNLAFGLALVGEMSSHFTASLGLMKIASSQSTYKNKEFILTMIFSEDSTSFEELKDIVTSYAILNSHLRYSIRWFEEIEFLKIISYQKMLPFEIGRIASLTGTLDSSEDTERLLYKVLADCDYVLEERTHSTSVYFMSAPTLKECEVVLISELNTIPELTMSDSSLFNLGGDTEETIKVDRLLGIRVREVSRTSKAKNSLAIMVYSNCIPICMNENEADHYGCFHHSLFKGLAQQVIQMMDPKVRKTCFPNIGVSSNTLQKDPFTNSTEHITFEYDRYIESQGTEMFLVINVSHSIKYLDSFSLENLKLNVAATITKDLSKYLEISYQKLSKSDIFHSMGHKKVVNLESCSIPALASLLSELTDEIRLSNTLSEFASLPFENRVDLLKKSLTKICLLENALGQ